MKFVELCQDKIMGAISGLDGFRLHGGSDWQIQNDTLTGSGNDGTAITKQQFAGPFELQVWVKTIVNGNGGVLFNYGNRGVEVQCFNAPDSTNPTGSLYGIAPASRAVANDEQWFLLQIFNNGPNAKVLVNGERVCETDKLKPPYKGSIDFQQHTPNAIIHYRGARIKPQQTITHTLNSADILSAHPALHSPDGTVSAFFDFSCLSSKIDINICPPRNAIYVGANTVPAKICVPFGLDSRIIRAVRLHENILRRLQSG